MTKWEYMVMEPEWMARNAINHDGIRNQLDRLGKDGWELVEVVWGKALFLKRPRV